jgi:formate dehydrogenase major subunit
LQPREVVHVAAVRVREVVVARRSLSSMIERWPVVRQWRAHDLRGDAQTATSLRTATLAPHTEGADRVVKSVCPYCAVGCGQRVYVRAETIIDIEGDPDSPISRGRLCPKGAATKSLVTGNRLTTVKYRRPYGTQWEDLSLDRAMDMIAERVIETRRSTWQDRDEQGRRLARTLGFAHLGGATLDNEENYLLKKLYTALGALQIENQARI